MGSFWGMKSENNYTYLGKRQKKLMQKQIKIDNCLRLPADERFLLVDFCGLCPLVGACSGSFAQDSQSINFNCS